MHGLSVKRFEADYPPFTADGQCKWLRCKIDFITVLLGMPYKKGYEADYLSVFLYEKTPR